MELKEKYQSRLSTLQNKLESQSKRDNLISMIRLLLFAMLIAVCILIFQWSALAGILFIYAGISVFYFVVKNHEGLRTENKVLEALVNLNEAEIQAIENDFSFFGNGIRYTDHDHPFAMDLDLFGEKSLFQKLNRCSSISGENKLAEMLAQPIEKEKIISYQEANKELETKLDWRQRFYALGLNTKKDQKQLEQILNWSNTEDTFKVSPLILYLIPIICNLLFIYLFFYVNMNFSWMAYIPTAILTFLNNKKITRLQQNLTRHTKFLKTYAGLTSHIEEEDFDSTLLVELHSKFYNNNIRASKSIKKLSFYLNQLDQRLNIFTAIFNLVFLWDHVWLNKVHKWKKSHAKNLQIWFDTLGEFESINSSSTLAYNNPTWIYADIYNESKFHSRELAHPLLHYKSRVANDFSAPSKKHIKIITGSNMGGKSTFLRTVGINATLTYLGTKACAHELSIPYLKFFTSMRTKDDLSDNTSSFYAELKRLKIVLDAVKSEDNVFFLLDEILKGTNTKDRHRGAKALILQLLKHNGSGLISTHDLELGLMASDYEDQIENLCFEVNTDGDKLIFDYKIKEGISKSFNATQLMREMGIEV